MKSSAVGMARTWVKCIVTYKLRFQEHYHQLEDIQEYLNKTVKLKNMCKNICGSVFTLDTSNTNKAMLHARK